jgi:hypothetical protein
MARDESLTQTLVNSTSNKSVESPRRHESLLTAEQEIGGHMNSLPNATMFG